MARRRRRSRRRRRKGLGSVIAVRRRRGLGKKRGGGKFNFQRDAMPLLVGGGAAAATIGGIRHFVDPTKGDTERKAVKHAPWLGLLAGAAASGLMYVATKKRMGKKGLYMGVAGAAAAGLTAFMMDQLVKAKPETVAALGAIVPEYAGMAGLPGGGLGAIVMEPQASRGYGAGPLGSYGEEVNLGGINQGAFGTAGFTV